VVARVSFQKIKEGISLASGRTQMQIGDKDGSVMHKRDRLAQGRC
jgi:hypothetical protein